VEISKYKLWEEESYIKISCEKNQKTSRMKPDGFHSKYLSNLPRYRYIYIQNISNSTVNEDNMDF